MLLRQGILPAILLCLLLFTSCKHKDLLYEDNSLIEVHLNFNYDVTAHSPEAMRVFFYPSETNAQPFKFDVSGTGGYIRLPQGTYNVLAYNVDTENVIEVESDYWDTFMLTTPGEDVEEEEVTNEESSTRMIFRTVLGNKLPKGEHEATFRYHDAPEWTCVARAYQVEVPLKKEHEDVSTDNTNKNAILTLTPEPVVYTVNVTINGVEGLSRVATARGTLSGVSAGMYPGLGHSSSEACFVLFNTRVSQANGVITGQFYVWDPRPFGDEDTHQYLNVYIWANSGNFYVSADITEQIKEAAKVGKTDATIDLSLTTEMDLTQGATGDSGFEPSVNNWEQVHQGIQM